MRDRIARNIAAYGLGLLVSLNYSDSDASNNIRRSYEPCPSPINLSIGEISIPLSFSSIDETLSGDLEIRDIFSPQVEDYLHNQKKSLSTPYNSTFHDPLKESLYEDVGFLQNPQRVIKIEYNNMGFSISNKGDFMFMFRKEF